jgi:hypothetical protein
MSNIEPLSFTNFYAITKALFSVISFQLDVASLGYQLIICINHTIIPLLFTSSILALSQIRQ